MGAGNIFRMTLNGEEHKSVYQKGLEYYNGYFVDSNRFYVVVRN